MPSRKSGKHNSVRFKVSRRVVLSFTILILLVNGIVFFLMHLFSQRDYLEHIDFTPNYDIILTEAKTFWGGVWFNTNRLFILRNEFMIEKNPLIGERKSSYPLREGKKCDLRTRSRYVCNKDRRNGFPREEQVSLRHDKIIHYLQVEETFPDH